MRVSSQKIPSAHAAVVEIDPENLRKTKASGDFFLI